MKIIIPGGSGQVGTLLARAFVRDGHDVVVLARTVRRAPWRVVQWDGQSVAAWASELDGADVVTNLAGRSVNCRDTERNRHEMLESRVLSVRAVGQAIAIAKRPPAVWLQMSTATIYAHSYDRPNDDITGELGGSEPDVPDTWKFSIDVATAWERALDDAPTPATRKLKLRSAMVMSPDANGIFDTLLTLVRRGLGGTAASGRQYISWIHETDFVRAVQFLIDRDDLYGAVNLSSPNPQPNREFMSVLRDAWGAPFGLPATRWMLEVGAMFMQTETELVLKSRRVIPTRLLHAGFTFTHPSWAGAASDLCSRVRVMEQR